MTMFARLSSDRLLRLTAGLALITSASAFAAGDTTPAPGHTADDPHTMIIKVVTANGSDAATTMSDDGPAPCKAGAEAVNTTSETVEADGKKRVSRIIMCRKDGGSPADQASIAKHLEDARKRIADSNDLADDTRAKVLAALDAEIAKLKAAN